MKLQVFLGFLFIAKCSAEINFMLANATAEVGSDATIPCTYEATGFEGMVPTLRWYAKKGAARTRLYVFVQDDDTKTFKASGVPRNLSIETDGSLIIPGVNLADNADFSQLICEVDFGAGGSAEGVLDFSVYAFPNTEPVTERFASEFDMSTTSVMVGDCKSGGGFPEPVITFYKGSQLISSGNDIIDEGLEGDILSEFGTDNLKTPNADGTISVQKTLNVPLGKADDNTPFYCIVTTTSGDMSRVQNKSMPLFRVKFPTDEVTITTDAEMINVGDTITLQCMANGYPEPSITSFNDGSSATTSIVVSKDDNGRVITCTANNPTSNPVTGSYTINVNYLDEPTITGSEVVELGSPINLSCASAGNPSVSSIMWKKNGEHYSNEETISIPKAGFQDSGAYTCVATNGDKTVEQHIEITVNGLVTDDQQEEVDVTSSDAMATMVCSARAHPAPMFTWVRVGSDEEAPEAELSMSDGEYVSSIMVGPLDKTFSNAEYTCTIVSGTQSATKKFIVPEIVQDTTPKKEIIEKSGSPTAGIIIGILVALLVVAIIIAVLYNKGIICNKGEKGDENAEDIAVEINKDEAPANDDVESGRKPEDGAEAEEDTRLVNGNGDQ